MGLMDILEQYVGSSAPASVNNAPTHFDEVARAVPPSVVGQGVSDAFRADNTPPFGAMVGQMFGQSSPQQQAGLLNQLIAAIGPGVLGAIGGGASARALPATPAGAQGQTITPQQASQLTPEQVQAIAEQAQQHDPTILDSVGAFYGQHPQLVKTLGSAALAIALAGVANRMRR
jgi:hypothetical protein